MSLTQRALEFLLGRRGAYRAVFDLANPRTEEVLRDLARFCRANSSTAPRPFDPYAAARLDGRREVWLRIQHHLRLTDEQIWLLYARQETVSQPER